MLADLETPAYVYDLDEVRRCAAALRAALPEPTRIYYSFKANPHPAVVSALREQGCHAEVCSPGELATALDAGFPAAEVLYTGPGKRDQDVTEAVKSGIRLFSVDSPHGIDQLDSAAAAQGVTVRSLVRVNDLSPVPGQGLTMTGVASQFGADADWVLAEPERFGARDHVLPAGYHLYMGTNLTESDALLAQFRQSASTARWLAETTGTAVQVLDLGGGFGAPFAKAGVLPRFDGLAERIADLLDETFPGWRAGSPVVAFESGRHLVATSGTLYTRVLDVKRSHGRDVLVLESGINHLGGMSGLRRLPPITPDVLAAEGVGEPLTGAIVAGPLCTPLDTWSHAASLPAVRPGDLVSVPNVGAYGLSASLLAFLGHPAPVEAVREGGRITDVSRLHLHRQDLNRM
ncbi:type III PLP-dependent enzyme [Kutzneria albida]|uniref:Diaminopimelate decarboxylase n=1 Tax=Kutzneria albida DSM 43870 TaxID=1449976 RepID=W5WG44_9PSEU|nr:type III PLP-dependent enzyme [Kutzneria albida]AHH99586.1 hypothetical protein KALB_6226 [Kutzneria albida DSM 43870]